MKGNIRKFDPELFKSTHEYYVKYRPGIPKEVIDIIVKHFDIKLTDRILDIGCGTGQVALAMEGRCNEMICLDPDPEMLKLAKKTTKDYKMKLTWLNYGSEDLGKIREKIGILKLATICRGLHWMNQEQVLNDLDGLINKGGGVAIFGDRSFWTGDEGWQQAIKKVVQKYLGEKRRAGKSKFQVSKEPWENIISRSPFKFIQKKNLTIIRNWNIESIIGYLFSTSFAAPVLFGNQIDDFKQDIEKTLTSIDSSGIYTEKATWSIILASRKH